MKKNDREAIRAFEEIAKRYCKIIERHKSVPRSKLLDELAKTLPGIYAATWNLPPTENVSDTLLLNHYKDDEWVKLFHSLQRKLGSWDIYRQVFDPAHDKEAITQCLADDLADIYRELQDYLLAVANGARLEDAVWEMRLGFESHWGRHLTNALNVIHEVRFQDDLGPWPKAKR